ncbi:MAG: hypothetical protein FWD31_02160 [Planctomycetaceae bacterium]|nr:hypothetical protein [Planctomycetaceae bacterium]
MWFQSERFCLKQFIGLPKNTKEHKGYMLKKRFDYYIKHSFQYMTGRVLRLESVNVEKRRVCPMKSKFLIVSLALCLVLGTYAQAYDCGCNDVNPCNACNACCQQKCDLFSGLKNLLKTKPRALNACGPCDAVVACAPCEPVVYAAPCEPFGCGDVGCFDSCGSCFNPCNPPNRPLLKAAKKTQANVKKFFNGLFGSLKGCDCGLCRGGSCNPCDPCVVACDPCGPAVNCYSNVMPTAIPD